MPSAWLRVPGRSGAVAMSSSAAAELRSRMQTTTPATNHSGEGVIGFLGFWIGGGGEELVAGWFWREESTRGRAAVVSPSPVLWCSLGAATGWGGGSGLEEGGEVLSGCRGALL